MNCLLPILSVIISINCKGQDTITKWNGSSVGLTLGINYLYPINSCLQSANYNVKPQPTANPYGSFQYNYELYEKPNISIAFDIKLSYLQYNYLGVGAISGQNSYYIPISQQINFEELSIGLAIDKRIFRKSNKIWQWQNEVDILESFLTYYSSDINGMSNSTPVLSQPFLPKVNEKNENFYSIYQTGVIRQINKRIFINPFLAFPFLHFSQFNEQWSILFNHFYTFNNLIFGVAAFYNL